MQPLVIFLAIAIIFSVYYVMNLSKETGEIPKTEESTSKTQPSQISPGKTYKAPTIPSTPATPESSEPKVSLYFGKVKFNNVSHSSIELRAQFAADEKINITNWKIKGRLGEITIPQGVELFIPGSSISNQDIFVKNYYTVYLYSASNPFKVNQNFRSNKCFGYLENYYGSLSYYLFHSKICPKIDREEIWRFSKECQSSILKLEYCRIPDYSNEPHALVDPCHSYIQNYISENLNYDGCIENYYKDEDFLKKYWYIYVGYDIICDCSDTLYLYDRNGLLVDEYHYERYGY